MPEEHPAPPRVPDYELLRPIGRGSYGVVWLARSVTGLYRAVKIVWRASFEDPQPYEREFRGIKEFAAVSLVAPRQLALLHVGRNDAEGFFYYVMELADDVETGREIEPASYIPNTLKEVRARRHRLPATEAVTLAVELAEGLAELHQRGLVHRDIKPSNIIFVGGAPKLADIGLVASTLNSEQTMSRVGNPGYMPQDFPGVPSADVFGLGRVLYELATGRERDDFPALPDLAAMTDRKELLELNEVLLRACAPDPAKRYPHASALLEDLRLLQAGKSVRRLRAAERHLGRALRAAAVLAIAAIVAGTGAWLATREAKKEMILRAEAEKQRDELARRRTYSGNLASAQSALGQGDLARARNLLKELEPKPGEPDLRGFEWRALWHQAQGDPHEEIRRNGLEIDKLVLSPDEAILAAHDKSDTVTLYETATHREILRVPGVWKLVGFSADGQWLIGADKAMVSLRWSVHAGHADKTAAADIGLPLVSVGASEVLALARDERPRLRRWNFDKRTEALSIDLGMAGESPRWNEFIASARADGRVLVRVWLRNTDNRPEYRLTCIRLGEIPEVQHRDVGSERPTAVGVDAIGPWALFEARGSSPDGTIWRCGDSGWRQTEERLPRGVVKSVEFSLANQHTRLIAVGRKLGWLPAMGHWSGVRWTYGHDATINEVVVSTRHGRLFSSATDGALFSWSLAGPIPTNVPTSDSNVGALRFVFSSDSKYIWVTSDGYMCALLEVSTLTRVGQAAEMRYPLMLLDRQLVGVGAQAGLTRVDASSGALLGRLMTSTRLRVATVSGDGHQIAAIDDHDNLLAADGDEPRQVKGGFQWYTTMMLDRTGRRLWVTNPNTRELLGLTWPDGREIYRIGLKARPANFLLLPDEQRLAVALENGNLEIRRAGSGLLLAEVYSGSSAPQALALSPDGRRLFVAGLDGDIHCFDSKSWEEIHVLALGAGVEFHRLACSPDGKTLSALTKAGALYLVRTE